jgi:ADP-heptose:LPS heptosyltransferase
MLGEIGDLVVVMPTIDLLRRRYPGARITLLVRGFLSDLVRVDPRIDELLPLRAKSLAAKIGFLFRLARRRWDLWVDLHTPTFNTVSSNDVVFRRNARLLWVAGCRYRLGFAMPEQAGRLTHARPVPPPELLAAENIVATTARLVGDAPGAKRLYVNATDADAAERLLARHHIGAVPPVALFFGAKQEAKVWPFENLQRFLALLAAARPEQPMLLIGGPTEVPLAARLETGKDITRLPRMINLIGATRLGLTMALLARCRAAVMTDSGPMHIAEALGIPLIALFSAHNHPVWHPTSGASTVLRRVVDCAPCFLARCPHENLCMARIEPESVLEVLLPLLDSGAS